MIVTNQIVKIIPNGKKWHRSVINLTKDVGDELGTQEKVVTLIILEDGEKINEEIIKSKLNKLRRIRLVEEELKKLKSEV